jgi:prepilin-type N-terminal cleavage/methylation domain-containing protein
VKIFTKKINKDQGFTIVELLVVIVVIGILAAITIVSYAGITARANSASSQAAGNAALSKAQVYAQDGPTSKLPKAFADLQGAASDKTYYLSASSVTFTTATADMAAQPGSTSTVQLVVCGLKNATTAATSYADMIAGGATVVNGIKINYWKYDGTPGVQTYTEGNVTTGGSPSVTCWAATA